MALEWFCLGTWIKTHWWGKKEWQREGGLALQYIHPSIYFPQRLSCVGSWDWRLSWVIVRTTLRTDGQSITGMTNTHSLQSPVQLSCMSLYCERNHHQHRERTYKLFWDSNTAHTVPHLYWLLYIFFFSQVNFVNADGFCFWYIKK